MRASDSMEGRVKPLSRVSTVRPSARTLAMCEVSVENVRLLKLAGSIFLFGGVLSVTTGTTYYRGLIHRVEQPLDYWVATGCLFFLGGLILISLAVCPQV